MVLIRLRWIVAAVLLKRSKAEGGGWMVITAGWAFAGDGGSGHGHRLRSSDAHLNPAVTIGFAIRDSSLRKFMPLSRCAIAWRDCRRPRWSGFTIFRTGRRHPMLRPAWLLCPGPRFALSPEPAQ